MLRILNPPAPTTPVTSGNRAVPGPAREQSAPRGSADGAAPSALNQTRPLNLPAPASVVLPPPIVVTPPALPPPTVETPPRLPPPIVITPSALPPPTVETLPALHRQLRRCLRDFHRQLWLRLQHFHLRQSCRLQAKAKAPAIGPKLGGRAASTRPRAGRSCRTLLWCRGGRSHCCQIRLRSNEHDWSIAGQVNGCGLLVDLYRMRNPEVGGAGLLRPATRTSLASTQPRDTEAKRGSDVQGLKNWRRSEFLSNPIRLGKPPAA